MRRHFSKQNHTARDLRILMHDFFLVSVKHAAPTTSSDKGEETHASSPAQLGS
jgi:hypothetical protein